MRPYRSASIADQRRYLSGGEVSDVPAHICTICGEEYGDAAMGCRLSQITEKAVSEGVQVDVRRYQAA